MLRVDVFSREGKFYLVPVYVHHTVTRLPGRAIVAYKPERQWIPINDQFEWCFSLYPNDLIQVSLRKQNHFGYFSGCDRATGAISIWVHDRDRETANKGLVRGIGIKTALGLKKFDVDVLGRIFPAKPEPRRGLA